MFEHRGRGPGNFRTHRAKIRMDGSRWPKREHFRWQPADALNTSSRQKSSRQNLSSTNTSLLLKKILERSSRVVRTAIRDRHSGRQSAGVTDRRSILLHRHAKFEKRAVVLHVLARNPLGNRLGTFKLRS